ncbi:PREDICTED: PLASMODESMATA CALLOSE-BINDING PROTEIN 3-like [Ipomoea nil]|uniref:PLASMODESMATA CALLOSE-BINDING PROTEIN 3-like n=1 Tax=Ipomoea nil TaxID=35883 RepID=UPI00090120E0|nr:PREDICTED: PLASMODESMATA CALLOSE-BINDING PROTEIN 3-like [Ipomoea nil]
MAAPPSTVALILFTLMMSGADATWCVARSDASDQTLQRALDYACGSGADCAPILSDGLCFLPNTILAHASYAFNSFYQRKAMGPGSCNFAGTATVAKTDPSYGSCVYPSSPSTAGGGTGTGTGGASTTPPAIYPPPPPPPPSTTAPFPDNGIGPQVPDQPNSGGSKEILVAVSFLFLLPCILQAL